MKVALITSSEQPVYFFPELAAVLVERVSDLEIEEFFVPFGFDIPFQAKACKNFDAVLACYHYDSDQTATAALVIDKLVDVELSTGVKIVKAVEPIFDEDLDREEDLAAFKDALVEKWSNMLLGVLYDSSVFKPAQPSDSAESDEEK